MEIKKIPPGVKVMIFTALVILLIVYLFISIVFKLQLLMTPCELCVESQPYLKQCFGEQMYQASVLDGVVINWSELETFKYHVYLLR